MTGNATSSLIVPGAVLAGKFRLDALIGEGGMGSVWSATHIGLNQAVAIKFISRDFVRSQEALRRFDAEAKAAAQLRSRHVVQVFDTGTLEDGTPYIAMELLHGESLQARVHRGGPVPLAEAVDILTQCGKALGRAHAAGIVHRDIKPDNIFLSQSNDDDAALVKILDFGVAKMGGGSNEQGSQGATRTGAVLGTPLYMSPEQARGLKTIDHRTDLYSLGLVAYTMFTGNLAFSSESFGDLLLQICTAPLPSLSAGAPWLPPSVEQWFQKACAREPDQRFGSAQEFVDALRTIAGVTVQMPQVGRGSSLPEVPSQLTGTAGGGRPAFASTGGGSAPGISRSGGEEVYAPPGTASKRWMGVVAGLVVVAAALGAGIVVVGRGKSGPAAASPAPVEGMPPQASASAAASASAPVVALAPPPPATAAVPPPPPHAEKITSAAPPTVPHPVKPTASATPPAPSAPRPHPATPAAAGTVDLGY
jgi:serine/threonine protein kinase